MGLSDKLFKKDDEKSNRDVGSNFDKSDADKIFDALDRVESKEKRNVSENLKKEINNTKEVSDLINEAQKLMMSEKFDPAKDIYKKVLIMMPENSDAYIGLADIYSLENNKDNEIKILKSAISKVNNNNTKTELMKRLKQLNE